MNDPTLDSPVIDTWDLTPAFAAELARRANVRAHEDRDSVAAECLTLSGFVRAAWHVLEPMTPYVHNWHIDDVCDHLTAVTDGFIKRLVINIPPGTMKSLLVSVFWPAWEWGPRGLPHMRYLTTSYEQELVLRDNLRMRRLVESEWYQSLWGDTVKFTRDQRAKGKFENTAMGGREGRAFSSLTGGRGDRVIIDDPHSTITAESDADRSTAEKIMSESVPSRVNSDDSAIVLMMQRLHERDATAVFLRTFPDAVHLRLPMRLEVEPTRQSDGTLIGGRCATRLGPGMNWIDRRRVEGELLFPDRFPEQTVAIFERMPYSWAGQYQQRPGPREGALFRVDNIEAVTVAPLLDKVVRGWDLAATEKKRGTSKKGGSSDPDWTAGVKIGKGRDGLFYILDVRRDRLSPGKVREMIKGVASQDGPAVHIAFPKDPGQAGVDQVASYATLLSGYILKSRPPSGSKTLRAEPLAAMVDLGLVRMVRAPWNQAFIDELRAFPAGAHDDQADAAADAFNEVAGVIPGQHLLDYYRQDAERAAMMAAGIDPESPTRDASLVGVIPPQGERMASGREGDIYRVDEQGVMWVSAEDASIFLRNPRWSRAELDVGEA